MFAKTIINIAVRGAKSQRTMVSVRSLHQLMERRHQHPNLAGGLPASVKRCRCYSADHIGGKDNSKSNETSQKSEEEIRAEILDNALKYIHSHGWSKQALAKSSEELGYPSIAEGIFSQGESELVLHFIQSCNKSLKNYMEQVVKEKEGKKTSEFIRDVVEHRLRMIIPYVDSWPDAVAITMRPPVVSAAAQELGRMVDDIWFHAGDKSTDFNWYTKRGILAKLYGSTQVVMLNDQSPDFTETWQFLDRRMKDVATFGKITSTIQRQGQMIADVGFAGFTVLRNISGLGDQRR